jgi:hypothetical protein
MDLICPISTKTINKSASRIGATLTALFLVLYAITGFWLILVLVVIDYAIRVLTPYQAPISILANWTTTLFRIEPQPMNEGPKLFAWRLGFAMAVVALVLLPFSPLASVIVALILAGLNILDGVGNLCVGCVIYTYLVLPYFGPKDSRATTSKPSPIDSPIKDTFRD